MLRDGLVVEGVANADTASIAEMAGKKVTTVGSMFVYIPRYAYKITYLGYGDDGDDGDDDIRVYGNAGTVLGYSNSIGIVDTEGRVVEGTRKEGAVEVNGIIDGKQISRYVLHPAFQKFETDELTVKNGGWKEEIDGIWVAKFEASHADATSSNIGSSATMKIQPGVSSWRSINVNDIFTKCSEYNSTLNSHMMKNSEWGAVEYLSYVYGIGLREATNYYLTGGGEETKYITNTAQCTTGNVYGIYNMDGGAFEYLASYVDNGHENLINYGSSLANSKNAHLKQIYSVGDNENYETNYETNKGRYGDAIYEINKGYGNPEDLGFEDWIVYPSSSQLFFIRGGYWFMNGYMNKEPIGRGNGDIERHTSFRPILVVSD